MEVENVDDGTGKRTSGTPWILTAACQRLAVSHRVSQHVEDGDRWEAGVHPSLAEKFKSRVFLEKTIHAINMTELRTKSLWSIWMFGLEQGLAFILWVSSIHALGCEQGSGSLQSLETAVWWDWVLVVVSSFHKPLELLHQLSPSFFYFLGNSFHFLAMS